MEAVKTTLAFVGVLVDDLSDLADRALESDLFYGFGMMTVGALVGLIFGVEIGRS